MARKRARLLRAARGLSVADLALLTASKAAELHPPAAAAAAAAAPAGAAAPAAPAAAAAAAPVVAADPNALPAEAEEHDAS